MVKKVYVYSKLPGHDFFYFRVGGSGLANCMIVAARAYAYSKVNNCLFITPTWERLGIGVWLRAENDKRFYIGLFKNFGISGMKKAFILLTDLIIKNKKILYFKNLSLDKTKKEKIYFEDLFIFHNIICEYYKNIINTKSISLLKNINFSNYVAVHIRLGDYKKGPYYVSVDWFRSVIINIKSKILNCIKFKIFSDGTNEELSAVLQLPDVERAFYGNPLADIIAMSRCKMLIGSDSTFSGMAAFLGQVPCVFNKKHYGRVLIKNENELVIGDNINIPNYFLNTVFKV